MWNAECMTVGHDLHLFKTSWYVHRVQDDHGLPLRRQVHSDRQGGGEGRFATCMVHRRMIDPPV